MEKIASFTINHLLLEPGVYVSRRDKFGDTVLTTFDLRMTAPNREPVMNTAELHTLEHLGATFLRNDPEWKDRGAEAKEGGIRRRKRDGDPFNGKSLQVRGGCLKRHHRKTGREEGPGGAFGALRGDRAEGARAAFGASDKAPPSR